VEGEEKESFIKTTTNQNVHGLSFGGPETQLLEKKQTVHNAESYEVP